MTYKQSNCILAEAEIQAVCVSMASNVYNLLHVHSTETMPSIIMCLKNIQHT